MTARQSRLLLAASAWTLYVWITRAVILAGQQDKSASFKAVHFFLAAVSIAFGIAIGWIGLTARRRQGEATPPAAPPRAEAPPPASSSS